LGVVSVPLGRWGTGTITIKINTSTKTPWLDSPLSTWTSLTAHRQVCSLSRLLQLWGIFWWDSWLLDC
jgi:hypothetical protein